MNGKQSDFSTGIAMGWVTFSYSWRTAVIVAALLFLDIWFLEPKHATLALVLGIVVAVIGIWECVRRILRCRAKLHFVGDSLQVNGYLGSSFRLDALKKGDFLPVQNSSERLVDTGRLLIKDKGVYLRGVKNFRAMQDYISENFSE